MLKKEKRVLAILTALAMMVSLTCSSGYLILAEDMVATGQGLTDEELSEPRQPGPEKQEESESVHPGDQAAEGEGHEADEGSDSSPGDNGGAMIPKRNGIPSPGRLPGKRMRDSSRRMMRCRCLRSKRQKRRLEAQETNEGQDEISELVLEGAVNHCIRSLCCPSWTNARRRLCYGSACSCRNRGSGGAGSV